MDSADAPSADRWFVADTALVTRRIADETILVPVSSRVGDLDSIYTLSEVGSRIWALLEGPVSLREIVSVVCAEYDVSPQVASRDVTEFLESLVASKLAHLAVQQGA